MEGYLRATLPNASFFGFTGTPVKKADRDTYEHFSEGAEGYPTRSDAVP
jgi:type I restriction enzyme R subunit